MNAIITTPAVRSLRRALLLASGLGVLAMGGATAPSAKAEVTLNIQVDAPPPPPRHEVIVETSRPGPDYVWVDGYWDGAPGHYTWTAGRWDRPPHGHQRWVAPHWDRDHDGHYHQVRGEWRDR